MVVCLKSKVNDLDADAVDQHRPLLLILSVPAWRMKWNESRRSGLGLSTTMTKNRQISEMLIVLEVRNQRERDSEKNANIKCSLEGCLPFTDINSPIKRRFSAN